MRRKTKNILVSATAVGLACTLAAGALLQTSVSVAASAAMMPGIEEIVKNTNKAAPLRILEIVDSKSEAEIGYYVSNQEPFLKLYSYDTGKTDGDGNKIYRVFHSVEEGLSAIKTPEARKSFVENTPLEEGGTTGIKNIQGLCGGEISEFPLAFSNYEERYFLSDKEAQDSSWTKIPFEDNEIRTVELPGHYEKVNPGEGDYKKEETVFYPVRNDVPSDSGKAEYRENILGFAYVGEGMKASPYQVNFIPVTDGEGNPAAVFEQNAVIGDYDYSNGKYGYYENVYRELTKDTKPEELPGEKEPVEKVLLSADEVNPADTFLAPDEFGDGTFSAPSGSSGDFSDGFVSEEFGEASGEVFSEAAPEAAAQQILVGTDEDPMIYRAQLIKEFPNYKYLEYKNLSAVREVATKYPESGSLEITDGMITEEPDGAYKLWTVDASGTATGEYLYYVQGRSYVSMGNVRNLPADYYNPVMVGEQEYRVHPYYYRTAQTAFSCSFLPSETAYISDAEKHPDAYQYTGWYYALKPNNEDAYVKTEAEPTYYTSEAEFTLVPGKGDYKFVYNPDEKPVKVQVNHLYYRGGYTNHDWLKRFVFHLSPEDADAEVQRQFQNFGIQVDTLTTEEFEAKYGALLTESNPAAAAFSDRGTEEEDFSSGEEIQQPEFTEGEETAAFTEGSFADSETEPLEAEPVEVEPMISEGSESLVSFERFVDEETDGTETAPEEQPEEIDISEELPTEHTPETDFVPDDTVLMEDTDASDVFGDGEALEFSDGSAAVAAASLYEEELPLPENLSEYDLIYINGTLSENTARELSGKQIPCIVNAEKLSDEGMHAGFSAFLKTEDGDSNYVNQYIYIFRNTFGQDTDTQKQLVNNSFHTPFYQESEDGISDGTDAGRLEGFEEILEYIKSENQYREIGKTEGSSDEPTDGMKIPPLSRELSEARAVEYILNYRHKRVRSTKKKIEVLQIQPAKSGGQLNPNEVLSWLDENSPKIESVDTCCYNLSGNRDGSIGQNTLPGYMIDGNLDTYWYVSFTRVDEDMFHWETDGANRSHDIIITLKEETDISGFAYTSAMDLGALTEFCVSVYGSENKPEHVQENTKPLYEETGTFTYAGANDRTEKVFSFAEPVKGAKYIKIQATKKESSKYTGFFNCAEIRLMNEETDIPVNIHTMTSSEYVGHMEDINSAYDVIYIGDDCTEKNRDFRINGDEEMMYTHVGGAILAGNINRNNHLGLMDFDKTVDGNGQPAIKITEQQVGGNGSLRGSGNDITGQQYRELMAFVKSGYPVVIGNKLAADGKTMASGVDTTHVDNTSYMYRFLQDAGHYKNVMTLEEAKKSESFTFFMKLSKPVIDFEGGVKPPRSPSLDGFSDSEENEGYIQGAGLEYVFTVKNDSDSSPANTTYDCRLYLDLNFDGNLSQDEEQRKYVEITDLETNKVLSPLDGHYHLLIGKRYRLTRKIPQDYFKLITWKLEINSNLNSNVRTSVTGYSKRKNTGTPAAIRVLQIRPNVGAEKENGNWNLTYKDAEKESYTDLNSFQYLLAQVEDFAIDIEEKPINQYVREYVAAQQEGKNLLDDYDMLIIGFDDVYEDIPNTSAEPGRPGAVDAIKKFIQDGKSVLFSHDTTSFVNRDYNVYGLRTDIGTIDGVWKERHNWGYSLNTILRPIVGMDRYGITSAEPAGNTGSTIAQLLTGQRVNTRLTDSDGLYDSILNRVGDIAYVANVEKQSSYIETQGFSNWELQSMGIEPPKSTTASKINDGAITQYPYRLGDLNISSTHAQYYQLSLEKDRDINNHSDGKNDIVVWYCLSGDNDYFKLSPNDVRNSYYFYSCGNVIYTGVGHSWVEESSNLSEKKLFVNAIIAAASVTAVQPDVKFVEELNPAAEEETVRYYMTDQMQWLAQGDSASNILEKNMDFYFNVKDYNMVSIGLEEESQDMTAELFIEDKSGQILEDAPVSTPLLYMNPRIPKLIAYGGGEVFGDENGKFHLYNNNAYGFRLSDIEEYLYDPVTGGYKTDCRMYVRITSTVTLYGKPVRKISWAALDLKQRQLFDMD